MSSFRALSEVIGERGLFCSLYADRASHYWHTPDAGGKVDKDNPTQVGRALQRLGIELIAAYSPEARGRSERMFGTLQKRLPQELRLAGITGIDEANRFLKEVYLPQHNARFATPAEDQGTAFVPFAGALDDILCIHEDRTVANDNTVRYKRRALQIPADRHPPPLRQGHGPGARVSRRHARRLPRTPMPGPLQGRRRAHRHLNPAGRVIRFDATGQSPVDKWTAAPRLTTSPQAQQPQNASRVKEIYLIEINYRETPSPLRRRRGRAPSPCPRVPGWSRAGLRGPRSAPRCGGYT